MIGVFDSGSGGLTVLRALRRRMPQADFLYLGDTKHAPYGNRPLPELAELTRADVGRLMERGTRRVVSACNSVSAALALSSGGAGIGKSLELIEMVAPTVERLREHPGRILLCATAATVESRIYQDAFHAVGKDIDALAVRDLAGAIEAGAPAEGIERVIRDVFASVPLDSYDLLVLACTHFPLVTDAFERALGPACPELFDPADAVAGEAQRQFGSSEQGTGGLRFLLTRDSAPFLAFVAQLFPDAAQEIEVVE